MGQKPLPGKCIHCLRWHKELTWDHVFPKSWYPDTTPVDLYKWQVPSCRECNKRYGQLEEDLLLRMALCFDPSDPKCAGIVEKGLRAMNPNCAKNEKDRRARLAKRIQILSGAFYGRSIPIQATYPGFGQDQQTPIEDQVAVSIPAGSVKKLCEKIVRGIFYLTDKRFIQPPYKIDFFALTEDSAEPIKEILNNYGAEHAREPGIVVRRAVAPEDLTTSLFCVEIWGRFKMYASVTN